MKFKIFILFGFCFVRIFAQSSEELDSLLRILPAAKEDSSKVLLLNELSWQVMNKGDYEKALEYAHQGAALGEAIRFLKGVSATYNMQGLIYFNRGELSKALDMHLASLKIREEMGDLKGIAGSHLNMGNIYARQENYAKALEEYNASLKIKEELGDKIGIAKTLNNLGSIYNGMGELDKALEHYQRSMAMYELFNDTYSVADLHNNIGTVYQDQGKIQQALEQHLISLRMRRENGDKEGIATSCINLATIKGKEKKFDEAKKYLDEAMSLSRQLGAKDALRDGYALWSSLDSMRSNWKGAYENHRLYILYRDSIDNQESTEKIVQAEMNFEFGKKEALAKAEQDKKDAVAAAESRKQKTITWFVVGGFLLIAVFMVILLRNYRQKQRATRIIQEKNTELERLSLAASETDNVVLILDSQGKVEWANQSFTRLNGISIEDLKKQKGETIFEISNNPRIREAMNEAVSSQRSVVYESLNTNKEGKRIWESSTLTPIFDPKGDLRKFVIIDTDITLRKEAEEILSVKNKDITDSITYAKRIQGALLIPEEEIKKHFSDVFVLFRPKDIVSGDFYWFAESKQNNILAVADCTGHGVPGGFMSMLGFTMLQENLLQEDVRTTADAMHALDRKITATLNRNDRSYRDGMDMVLCAFNKNEPKLQFSSANRPLIRLRNKEIAEFKADKFPIGGAIDNSEKKFQAIDLEVQRGDIFYLFTDGYADQFGGDKQKKFMYRNLLDTLTAISDKSMNEQKIALEEIFDKWKSRLEQVDDVLIIGIKI